MGLVRTSPPTVEPVSVSEAKVHLEAIDSTHDTMLSLLIAAARQYAESYCNRSFITQSWRLTLDAFPGRWDQSMSPAGVSFSLPRNAVLLERAPIQSVDAITYTDMGGVERVIDSPGSPDYAIDLSGSLGRMTPGFGRIWPITLPQIGVVSIDYTAGYGDAATDVPELIRNWIMVRVNTMFENREEVAVLQRGTVSALPHVDRLLDEFRVITA